MDIKGMLMSVATVAVGYMVGLVVYNKFLAGSTAMTTTPPPAAEEGE